MASRVKHHRNDPESDEDIDIPEDDMDDEIGDETDQREYDLRPLIDEFIKEIEIHQFYEKKKKLRIQNNTLGSTHINEYTPPSSSSFIADIADRTQRDIAKRHVEMMKTSHPTLTNTTYEHKAFYWIGPHFKILGWYSFQLEVFARYVRQMIISCESNPRTSMPWSVRECN